MSTIVEMVLEYARVQTMSDLFPDHTGTVYITKMVSQDGAFTKYIVEADDAVTTSDFNALSIGSTLFDKENGVLYLKTGATTWATVTTS